MKEYRQYAVLEFYIYLFMRFGIIISILLWIIIASATFIFQITNVLLIKSGMVVSASTVFLLCLWMLLGTIFRWTTLIDGLRDRGAEHDLGRLKGGLFNIIFGILGCALMIYIIFHIINTDLTQIQEEFIKKR